jgi:hypothetical protein
MNGIEPVWLKQEYGRDCFLSGMDNYQRTKDTENPEFEAFSNLSKALQSIKRHCEKPLPRINWGKALIIGYEDLIVNLREAIRRCCEFLNLKVDRDFSTGMISYHAKNKTSDSTQGRSIASEIK